MASYIHGTGAEKLAPSEREERLQRKRRQDVGRSVKRQHRIRRRNVPCTWTCHMLSC
mgnify:CR=1 FL=1